MLKKAIEIINGKKAAPGFKVVFEHKDGCILRADFFPGRGEQMFASEHLAWIWAGKFAEKTRGRCVNIYVAHADGTPVEGYQRHKIENR